MSNSTGVKESEPQKKRRNSRPPSPSWSLLTSLPDEIALSCLARVSRSDHPALSMVSKSVGSIMASYEICKTRSLMGFTEKFHYVCLMMPPYITPQWFILGRGKLLRIRIPTVLSQPEEGSSVVALDWGIYVIGGSRKRLRTSDVKLLDCRTNTWHNVPSMKTHRSSAAVGVVGGKIYVFGGCHKNSSNWAEVFDPKTQTWSSLPPTTLDEQTRAQYLHSSLVVSEEKINAVDVAGNTYYYSPSESKWGKGRAYPQQGNIRDWCVIDNLIFCISVRGKLGWCEPKQLECSCESEWTCWNEVKGLGSLNETLSRSRLVHFNGVYEEFWDSIKNTFGTQKKLIDLLPGARIGNSGSNIVLFWDVLEGDHLEIWFAEISFEKRQGQEIWGNIEWSNAFMTVDPFLHHYKGLR